MAYPMVDFTSADGKRREFQDSTGSNPPSYDVGDRVEVLYRADDPGNARINGFLSLWLLPLIFSGVGEWVRSRCCRAGCETQVTSVRVTWGGGCSVQGVQPPTTTQTTTQGSASWKLG